MCPDDTLPCRLLVAVRHHAVQLPRGKMYVQALGGSTPPVATKAAAAVRTSRLEWIESMTGPGLFLAVAAVVALAGCNPNATPRPRRATIARDAQTVVDPNQL